MCGIAGIVGPSAADYHEHVGRMVKALEHRGPDGSGIYVAPSGNCVLGHRRLAILDVSTAAAQPMCSPDARFALSYNGEVYNFRELRRTLEQTGQTLTSTGDTEIVLHVLARSKAEGLAQLNGMFALALWDEVEQQLLLARDRFGQKPLYWARFGEHIIFASEVRALLASDLIPRHLDPAGVQGFLSFGATQGPSTIVRGVSLLPRASALNFTVRERASNVRSYWSPSHLERHADSALLRRSFMAAVERHLVSDAPIGMFLSGGLDSSAITAAAATLSRSRVTSLCVTFPDDPQASEAPHARRVAERFGTDHREIPVTAVEILRLLPTALDSMDQPTGDAINTFVVSHAARAAGLTVVLSGVGGDELFGGYPTFADIRRFVHVQRVPRSLRRQATRLLSINERFSRLPAKLIELLDAPAGVVPIYLARRKSFTSRQVAALAPALGRERWISGVPPERLAALEAVAVGRGVLDAVSELELEAYMGELLLRDADVMGMSRSLEIRLPFLDAELTDLALSFDESVREPGLYPKKWLADALGDLVPRENVERPKQGFAMPFERWMLHELRDQVSAGIDTIARHPLFDEARVREVWSRFRSRPEAIGFFRPWSLFILGRYLEQHQLV